MRKRKKLGKSVAHEPVIAWSLGGEIAGAPQSKTWMRAIRKYSRGVHSLFGSFQRIVVPRVLDKLPYGIES
jgi:hypothetical protein